MLTPLLHVHWKKPQWAHLRQHRRCGPLYCPVHCFALQGMKGDIFNLSYVSWSAVVCYVSFMFTSVCTFCKSTYWCPSFSIHSSSPHPRLHLPPPLRPSYLTSLSVLLCQAFLIPWLEYSLHWFGQSLFMSYWMWLMTGSLQLHHGLLGIRNL